MTFLDHGKVLFTGAPKDVFRKPRNPRLEQFLDTYLDAPLNAIKPLWR
jgi:polar amino acid transport system ATP-binding protein